MIDLRGPMPALALQLDLVDIEVHVRLHNAGNAAAWVLHDIHVQPSRPILRDAAGHEVAVVDDRSELKVDQRVFESMFVALPPGASLDLETSVFERVEQRGKPRRWNFTWGDFHYEGLAPGKYTLQFAWRSSIREVLDDQTEQPREVAGVWLGELLSEIETIELR